jgi:hypothetical protein
VSDLHSDDPENLMDSNSGRRITVRWFNGSREVSVQIPLAPDDYKRASDAHITGRRIEASGTLEQQGRDIGIALRHEPDDRRTARLKSGYKKALSRRRRRG